MNNITAEVVPQLVNIDVIMFKSVTVLCIIGFLTLFTYTIYKAVQ